MRVSPITTPIFTGLWGQSKVSSIANDEMSFCDEHKFLYPFRDEVESGKYKPNTSYLEDDFYAPWYKAGVEVRNTTTVNIKEPLPFTTAEMEIYRKSSTKSVKNLSTVERRVLNGLIDNGLYNELNIEHYKELYPSIWKKLYKAIKHMFKKAHV